MVADIDWLKGEVSDQTSSNSIDVDEIIVRLVIALNNEKIKEECI